MPIKVNGGYLKLPAPLATSACTDNNPAGKRASEMCLSLKNIYILLLNSIQILQNWDDCFHFFVTLGQNFMSLVSIPCQLDITLGYKLFMDFSQSPLIRKQFQ